MQSLVQGGEPGLGSCQVSAQSWLCMTLSEPAPAQAKTGPDPGHCSAESGVCSSPPLCCPRSLSSGSGTAANHYSSITRSQALTRHSQSLPPQATGNTRATSSQSRDTRLCFDCRILSLLGIYICSER